jgi:hypothetical protein
MSIGCSCLEFVTLGSAFLCFGSVVEFDLLDGSISGVVLFDLRECSDIGICLHGFKESYACAIEPLDSLAHFGSWDSGTSDAKIGCSQYRY